MPDVTKRLLTDETGQDIVDALESETVIVEALSEPSARPTRPVIERPVSPCQTSFSSF